MPISSNAAAIDKKSIFKIRNKSLTPNSEPPRRSNELLSIGSVLPPKTIQRAYSSLSAANVKSSATADPISLHIYPNGAIHISRTQKAKEKNPDRICLDRKGLTVLPIIQGESKLRLLSLQHNLVNNLDQLKHQNFPYLVFLDLYDNQLEGINNLEGLENLRVLLIGKNRIKKIEGLDCLKKLEVLDFHGNQIGQVFGLSHLSELKVLNLAGNQLRIIGPTDFDGLKSLQELNLRRNKLKKLLGFNETTHLEKLFLSNNDIQVVEDMHSIAKSLNIRELTIDNNPVTLGTDCISFFVSYLPKLANLNNMLVTEQVRKAAMVWRRTKELTNSTFMDLTSDVCINSRREEVISNARTNWELLRTQSKAYPASNVIKTSQLKPETDIILTSLPKREVKIGLHSRTKSLTNIKTAILPDKNVMSHTSSQDTENSSELFRLPPILVPIISKLEQKSASSSTGPNVDSSISCSIITSHEESDEHEESSSSESENNDDGAKVQNIQLNQGNDASTTNQTTEVASDNTTETSSNLSTNTSITISSNNDSNNSIKRVIKTKRHVKSANSRQQPHKINTRAATAKPKRQASPPRNIIPSREREQGGDYLIEICGRHLNIYGQGALRFIDKQWCSSKAEDVNTVNFNFANFNHIAGFLNKIKPRFINAEHFTLKENNITCLGQINALAEIQGLTSISICKEGNPICEKEWEAYAIFRLSHWGLKIVNGNEITPEEIAAANNKYGSLSELVLWSLPDELLRPLLVRLRIDVGNSGEELNPKKWLMLADPDLRSVVSKEALQWKKSGNLQDDLIMRQKARCHLSKLLEEMTNSVFKLRHLEQHWPNILQQIVRNTLLDYSQMDVYMKKKLQDLTLK